MSAILRDHTDDSGLSDPTRVVHRYIRTPFEDSVADGAPFSWTTVVEQTAFLTAVAAASDGRVSFEEVGQSVQGRPIHLVRVGNPAPTGPAVGTSVLVVAHQHGDEPSGREAALSMIRDLALMQDADSLAYLSDVTWLFMPCINPDKLGTARLNAHGVDLNRTHLSLAEPETRPIHAAIRDYQPVIVIDAHEDLNIAITRVNFKRGRNTQIDSGLRTYGDELIVLARAAEESHGYTTGLYASTTIDPRWLSNAAGLLHAVTMLIEVRRSTPDNLTDADIRVFQQRVAFEVAWEFHRGKRTELDAARAAAIAAKIAEGENQSAAFQITASTTINPPPAAYQLTGGQRTARDYNFTHWDLEEVSDGEGGVFVTMGQQAQPIIPFAFDDRADWNLISATPLDDDPEGEGEPDVYFDYDPAGMTDFGDYTLNAPIDYDPTQITDDWEHTLTGGGGGTSRLLNLRRRMAA